jgi:hypothetical protein
MLKCTAKATEFILTIHEPSHKMIDNVCIDCAKKYIFDPTQVSLRKLKVVENLVNFLSAPSNELILSTLVLCVARLENETACFKNDMEGHITELLVQSAKHGVQRAPVIIQQFITPIIHFVRHQPHSN